MKKLYTLIFLLFVQQFASAQGVKYITYDFTPESAPGACDAELHLETGSLAQPVQLYYYIGYRTGNEKDIYGLCSGEYIYVNVLDAACMEVDLRIYIASDPDSQVVIDTIIAVLPSTPTGSDGSISYSLSGFVPPNMGIIDGSWGYAPGTSHPSLARGECYITLGDSIPMTAGVNYIEYLALQVNFGLADPTPCVNDFDINTYILPASPGNCDGGVSLVPTVATTADYIWKIIGYHEGAGYPYLNTVDLLDFYSYAQNVCPQPVSVFAYPLLGSNNYFINYKVLFVGVDSSGTYSWAPPVIPPGIDTFVLSAVQDCRIDYATAPDLVYVDTIRYIGASTYEVDVVMVQDAEEFTFTGTVITGDTTEFFIDLTVYCPDSLLVRTGYGTYKSSRNIVYYGHNFITGMQQPEPGAQIALYPNPAASVLNISSAVKLNEIQVYTTGGKLLLSHNPNSTKTEINLAGLPASVYIVKCTDAKGRTGFSRFVKM